MLKQSEHFCWSGFWTEAQSKLLLSGALRSPLQFRSRSLTLSSLVSGLSSLQHTEYSCVRIGVKHHSATKPIDAIEAFIHGYFFTPFQWGVGVAGNGQEAGWPFCGWLVQVEDAAQLPGSWPLTCKHTAAQWALGKRQEARQRCFDRGNIYLTFT